MQEAESEGMVSRPVACVRPNLGHSSDIVDNSLERLTLLQTACDITCYYPQSGMTVANQADRKTAV